MRKAYNIYKDGSATCNKIKVTEEVIKKTGIGIWEVYDCLDFDDKSWRYEYPTEDRNLDVTSDFDSGTLTITIKKDGELYDPRGITVAVNYEDLNNNEEETE